MIVLSQDKNKVINLNNVLAIWIDNDVLDKTESFFTIEAETDGSNIELGRYNQEKRAREVFQELIETYCNMDNYLADFLHTKIIMYKMPEE